MTLINPIFLVEISRVWANDFNDVAHLSTNHFKYSLTIQYNKVQLKSHLLLYICTKCFISLLHDNPQQLYKSRRTYGSKTWSLNMHKVLKLNSTFFVAMSNIVVLFAMHKQNIILNLTPEHQFLGRLLRHLNH